jgi:hypothetical protein
MAKSSAKAPDYRLLLGPHVHDRGGPAGGRRCSFRVPGDDRRFPVRHHPGTTYLPGRRPQAVGILARFIVTQKKTALITPLTRHTPKDIADERERFQKLLALHRQYSDEAQRKILGYVRELEARICDLLGKIEGGLNRKEITKTLGEFRPR